MPTVLYTYAILTDLYKVPRTYAILTNLETERTKSLAVNATSEKAQLETLGLLTETQWGLKKPLGAISSLETATLIAVGFITSLESRRIKSLALNSAIEGMLIKSWAISSNLVYYSIAALGSITTLELKKTKSLALNSAIERMPIKSLALLSSLVYYTTVALELKPEVFDARDLGARNPIFRGLYPVTLKKGNLEISRFIDVNVEVKQITVQTPGLDGETIKIQLFDKIGAKLFESASVEENSNEAVMTTPGQTIPLVGSNVLNLVISGAQTKDIPFAVILYGT